MASFDIINAVGGAYSTSWNARRYLARLAFVPIALKLICYVVVWVFARGEDGVGYNYLTFMLIMLPALFAEGWMLSHYTRYMILGQTWPFRPTGNMEADMVALKARARGVISGTLVFVLINMAMGFLIAMANLYMMPYLHLDAAGDTSQIPPYLGFVSMLMLIGLFWAFRLLWLHVPFALNIEARDYLCMVKGFQTSFYMIAVWLVCFMPFFVVLQLLAALTSVPFNMAFGQTGSDFIMILLTVFADTFKSIVATAGITYGLKEIFAGGKATAK